MSARPRFGYVDALRGLAALAVMVYHFGTGSLAARLARVFPRVAMRAVALGWLGVHVFFVLSGFVIAYSVGRRGMTLRAAGLFALRRQVRLDPPYWTSMALACAVPWLVHIFAPRGHAPGPGLRAIFLHALYLQEALHVRPIQPVYWTLCIEVQFYLVFVLALCAARRLSPRVVPWLVAASGLWALEQSMYWRFSGVTFIPYWHLFALGAAVWFALDRRFPAWALAAWCAWEIARGRAFGRPEPVAGAVAALSMLLAGRVPGLDRWLAPRPLRFLGRVSYGVYLLHPFVAAQVQWLLAPTIDTGTPWAAVRVFVTTCALSVAAAWALHVTVERRALAWAGGIRWERAAEPAASGMVSEERPSGEKITNANVLNLRP